MYKYKEGTKYTEGNGHPRINDDVPMKYIEGTNVVSFTRKSEVRTSSFKGVENSNTDILISCN